MDPAPIQLSSYPGWPQSLVWILYFLTGESQASQKPLRVVTGAPSSERCWENIAAKTSIFCGAFPNTMLAQDWEESQTWINVSMYRRMHRQQKAASPRALSELASRHWNSDWPWSLPPKKKETISQDPGLTKVALQELLTRWVIIPVGRVQKQCDLEVDRRTFPEHGAKHENESKKNRSKMRHHAPRAIPKENAICTKMLQDRGASP